MNWLIEDWDRCTKYNTYREEDSREWKSYEEQKESQHQGDDSQREEDEISDDDAAAPQRKKIKIPIPRFVYSWFEAAQERIIYKGSSCIVQGAAQIQRVHAAERRREIKIELQGGGIEEMIK